MQLLYGNAFQMYCEGIKLNSGRDSSRPANRPGFSGTTPEIQAVSRCPEFLFENPGF